MSYECTLDLALGSLRAGELEDAGWLFDKALDQLCDELDPVWRNDRLGALILILERAGLHELAVRAAGLLLSSGAHDTAGPPLVEATQNDMLQSCLIADSAQSPAEATTQLALLLDALGEPQHALILLNKSLDALEHAPDPELEQRTRSALHRTIEISPSRSRGGALAAGVFMQGVSVRAC